MPRGKPYLPDSKCMNVGCETKPGWHNLCISCYKQQLNKKDAAKLGRPRECDEEFCSIPLCMEDVWCKGLCRSCYNARSGKKHREANPKSSRKHQLRKMGLTLEQYDEILHSQNGVCAICLIRRSINRSLAVDHCHDDTMWVRGLLCMRCNTALGKFQDSVEVITRALSYIKNFPKKYKVVVPQKKYGRIPYTPVHDPDK